MVTSIHLSISSWIIIFDMNQKYLDSFALFCKHYGTALHITEEEANPMSVYQKETCCDPGSGMESSPGLVPSILRS